jgi:hypothetical protein
VVPIRGVDRELAYVRLDAAEGWGFAHGVQYVEVVSAGVVGVGSVGILTRVKPAASERAKYLCIVRYVSK